MYQNIQKIFSPPFLVLSWVSAPRLLCCRTFWRATPTTWRSGATSATTSEPPSASRRACSCRSRPPVELEKKTFSSDLCYSQRCHKAQAIDAQGIKIQNAGGKGSLGYFLSGSLYFTFNCKQVYFTDKFAQRERTWNFHIMGSLPIIV